jgi:hypothetical protein
MVKVISRTEADDFNHPDPNPEQTQATDPGPLI